MKWIRKSIYIIPIVFILVACGWVSPAPIITETTLPNTTLIPPLSTLASTQLPTQISVRASTAIPTLNPDDSAKMIAELMRTNGECIKPCFWGIGTGVDSFDNTTAFIDSLGRKGLQGVKDSVKYYNTNYTFKDEVVIGLVLLEKDGIVQTIKVSVDGLQRPNITSADWLAFRPDRVLEAYGAPSSIKIGFWEGQNGFIGYQLLISYDNPSLQVLYAPEDSTNRPGLILHTCPLSKNNIGSFDISIGKLLDIPADSMYSIEEVSSFSTDEFSKLLIEKQENACFDFSLNLFYK